MDKLPSWQFYPGDWRKDPGVQALDYESRGIWFEILLLMFESTDRGKLLLNGLPMPDEALANILGLEVAKVQQTVSKLLSYGVASICQKTGALMNRRMSRDEYLRHVRAEAGSLGGKQKASKNIANGKQKVTPSSSSSSSSSDKKEEEEEEIFSSSRKQGNGIDTEPPVKHKRSRKKVKKEWPADGFFIRDFLAHQTFFDSHFDPEVLPKVKDKLDDAQWWEDLSHAVNGLDGETLHRNFAAISVWMHDHPRRIPTAQGLRPFISRWFNKAAEDERKKPWLIEKRAAKLTRR
jgi:hypothetical protein